LPLLLIQLINLSFFFKKFVALVEKRFTSCEEEELNSKWRWWT